MFRLLEEVRRLAYDRGQSDRSLDDACLRFIEEHLPSLKPEGAARYRSSIRALLRHLDPGMPLSALGQETFSDYITRRRTDAVTDTAIRRDFACLSSILTSAVDWGWLTRNPMRDYKARSLRRDTMRDRFLTPAEYKAILAKAGRDRPLVVFAVETGMRLSEILGLRWRDLDKEFSLATLTETKTDTPRTVPLSREALAQIRAQPAGVPKEHIFRQPNGRPHARTDVSRRFRDICKAANVEDFRFHDLRHTFASWKAQAGFDLYRIGKLLGHKGPQMTMRYAHLRTADLREVVADRAQQRAQRHGIKTQRV